MSNKATRDRKAIVWDYDAVFGGNAGERCVRLTDSEVMFLLTSFVAASWETRWEAHKTIVDMAIVRDFIADLQAKLITGSRCENGANGTTGNSSNTYGVSASDYDDFLAILEQIMPKFRIDGKIYEPVIDLIECGCGGGGDSGTENPADYGGDSGGWDNLSTLCDIVTSAQLLVLSRVEDFHDSLANYRFAIDFALPDEYISYLEAVLDSVAEINTVLDDVSFLEVVQKKLARQLPDPVPTTGLTRDDLRRFARAIPFVYEGAPMLALFVIWAEMANLYEINQQIKSISGTGDEDTCKQAFSGSGREPFRKPNTTPDVTVVLNGQYGVLTIQDTQSPYVPGLNAALNGFAGTLENFEAVVVVVSGLGASIAPESSIIYTIDYQGTDYPNSHKAHEVDVDLGVFTNNAPLVQTIEPTGVFGDLSLAEYKSPFTKSINDSVNSSLPDTVSNLRVSAINSNSSSGTMIVEGIYVIVNLSV